MNRENLKLRIKDVMTEKGITSRQLAERMGKTPQYIGNIINGGKAMSLNSLIKVADALDVKFGDLFESSYYVPEENGKFTAMVSCKQGLFNASSPDELQALLNTLNKHTSNAIVEMQKILERILRFPSEQTTDANLVSELIAGLVKSMSSDEWQKYWLYLKPLIPPYIMINYRHLSTYLTPDEIEYLKKALPSY